MDEINSNLWLLRIYNNKGMKSALVLTLLAAVALGWGSNSDEF